MTRFVNLNCPQSTMPRLRQIVSRVPVGGFLVPGGCAISARPPASYTYLNDYLPSLSRTITIARKPAPKPIRRPCTRYPCAQPIPIPINKHPGIHSPPISHPLLDCSVSLPNSLTSFYYVFMIPHIILIWGGLNTKGSEGRGT